MTPIEKEMIAEARQKYGNIYPLPNRPTFPECFTYEDGRRMLWVNTDNKSTRTVSRVENADN